MLVQALCSLERWPEKSVRPLPVSAGECAVEVVRRRITGDPVGESAAMANDILRSLLYTLYSEDCRPTSWSLGGTKTGTLVRKASSVQHPT